MNIDIEGGVNLSKGWFDDSDTDARPGLGMFFYDEDQPPYLLWEAVVGDSYDNWIETPEGFDITYDLSDEFDQRFSPDVDIRTYRSKIGTESVAYRYYDKEIYPLQYNENTAPTELEFYFYPRQPLYSPEDFFLNRPYLDMMELDSLYHLYIGFN